MPYGSAFWQGKHGVYGVLMWDWPTLQLFLFVPCTCLCAHTSKKRAFLKLSEGPRCGSIHTEWSMHYSVPLGGLVEIELGGMTGIFYPQHFKVGQGKMATPLASKCQPFLVTAVLKLRGACIFCRRPAVKSCKSASHVLPHTFWYDTHNYAPLMA
eukprot:1157873-Pelagomonas_calceolata.AAC.2